MPVSIGGMEEQYTKFLTLVLDEGELSTLRSSNSLPWGKSPWHLLKRKVGGHQDLVLMLWREEKFLFPTWNRTTIIF